MSTFIFFATTGSSSGDPVFTPNTGAKLVIGTCASYWYLKQFKVAFLRLGKVCLAVNSFLFLAEYLDSMPGNCIVAHSHP